MSRPPCVPAVYDRYLYKMSRRSPRIAGAVTADVVTSTGGLVKLLEHGIVWYSCMVSVTTKAGGVRRVPHGFLLAVQPVGGRNRLVLYDINSERINADANGVDFLEEFEAWEAACDLVGVDEIIPFSDLNVTVHRALERIAGEEYRRLYGQSDGGCSQYVSHVTAMMTAQGLRVDPRSYRMG